MKESEVSTSPGVTKARKSAASVILDSDVAAFYVFARYSDGRVYKTACGTPDFMCHAGAVASHLGVTLFLKEEYALTESFDG